jgi:hypothetical protein
MKLIRVSVVVVGLLVTGLATLVAMQAGGQPSLKTEKKTEARAPFKADWLHDPLYRASEALAGWWPGDGHACDLAGTLHAMRIHLTAFSKGCRGAAFSFPDGKGEVCLTTPMIMQASPSGLTDTFTLALWVYPTATYQIANGQGPRYAGTKGQRYAVFPSHGGTQAKLAGCGISVGTNGVRLFEHTSDNCPCVLAHEAKIEGWTHLAVVYQKGTPTLHINGAPVKTGARSAWTVFPGAAFGDQTAGYGPYQGAIDEVMVFKRALTGEEIKAVVLATSPKKPSQGARAPALSDAAFNELWSAISGERAPRSLFAVSRLAAGGDEAVKRLRSRLLPAPVKDGPSVEELIAQLDDDAFPKRERATQRLVNKGAGIIPKLQAALRGQKALSAEAGARIRQILKELQGESGSLTARQLRVLRVLAVLSWIDTPASRALLAEIARGPTTLPQTMAAKVLVELAQKGAQKVDQ